MLSTTSACLVLTPQLFSWRLLIATFSVEVFAMNTEWTHSLGISGSSPPEHQPLCTTLYVTKWWPWWRSGGGNEADVRVDGGCGSPGRRQYPCKMAGQQAWNQRWHTHTDLRCHYSDDPWHRAGFSHSPPTSCLIRNQDHTILVEKSVNIKQQLTRRARTNLSNRAITRSPKRSLLLFTLSVLLVTLGDILI